jgi:hypothetical protein
MRLRTKGLLSLSAGLGAVVLAATPAWAVNTSYLKYNTNPATQQSVLCQFGTSGNVLHPSELYRVVNNCSSRMWLHLGSRALCINPGTTADINRAYTTWQVTSNTARCT